MPLETASRFPPPLAQLLTPPTPLVARWSQNDLITLRKVTSFFKTYAERQFYSTVKDTSSYSNSVFQHGYI